jgi:hypothetical protein
MYISQNLWSKTYLSSSTTRESSWTRVTLKKKLTLNTIEVLLFIKAPSAVHKYGVFRYTVCPKKQYAL